MAMPPSVIVLMVMFRSFSANTDVIRESGIARTEMKVVLALHRKMKRMTTTRIAPSRSASKTLSTAVSMKFACRKMLRLI